MKKLFAPLFLLSCVLVTAHFLLGCTLAVAQQAQQAKPSADAVVPEHYKDGTAYCPLSSYTLTWYVTTYTIQATGEKTNYFTPMCEPVAQQAKPDVGNNETQEFTTTSTTGTILQVNNVVDISWELPDLCSKKDNVCTVDLVRLSGTCNKPDFTDLFLFTEVADATGSRDISANGGSQYCYVAYVWNLVAPDKNKFAVLAEVLAADFTADKDSIKDYFVILQPAKTNLSTVGNASNSLRYISPAKNSYIY